ncbi:MAG: SUMF1/EgtB/PvdO family nonheme iron enzyme, partial [Planctomycetales bacterium]
MISRTGAFWMLGLVVLGSVSTADDAPSGYRTALLVGNSNYEGFTLQGVGKSLDQVEQALKSRGFRVTRQENLDEKQLKAAAEEFAKSIPTNGVALIYCAGLGAHVDRGGKWYNLLRPLKAKIESDNDYRSRGLNVADLMQSLREQGGARINLLFLDACWKSPLKPEKGQVFGGLREFEIEGDAVVMFGAKSGQTAPAPQQDDASPLAKSLAKNIDSLDDSVEKTCQAVAADAGMPWFGGATDAGIGKQSPLPVAEELREGKAPGEGFVNSLGLAFRWCPPGDFTMGSSATDQAATRDREQVQVTLSKGFWMGEHEVTQREYNAVTRKNPPLGFTLHKNAPFWGVTESKQVTEFCKKLTELERKSGALTSGWEYVCPTEAEWEYACRAGSNTAFCFGDSVAELGRYGNFADNALRTANPNFHWASQQSDDGVGESLAPVGGYLPNAWGLRDMHGTVAEVVAEHLVPELPGGQDPQARLAQDGLTHWRG